MERSSGPSVVTKKRRTKLYNIRLSDEEEERFRSVANVNGLDVSQMIRTLVAQASRRLGGEPSPAERADTAWSQAHSAFLRTGIAGTLGRSIVIADHVRATLAWLDKAMAAAKECGASEVHVALARFRSAVELLPKQDNTERAENVQTLMALMFAHAEASERMRIWATRRAGI